MKDKEIVELQLEAWKTVVETQRHFNDVAMKVRHFGFILVAAMIGASGFSIRSGYELQLEFIDHPVPVASFLLGVTALLWLVIWFLDAKWYTPFLIGSVESGERLERIISQRLDGVDLTQSISKTSKKQKIFCINISSKKRSMIFHWFMFLILAFMSISLAGFVNVTDVKTQKKPVSSEKLEQSASESNDATQ